MKGRMLEQQREAMALLEEIETRLAGLSEKQLASPATWQGLNRHARFLMHRLTAHVSDHGLQLRKGRQAMGVPMSEAQGILAQFAIAQMAMLAENFGLSEEEYVKAPTEGEWSAEQVIAHVIEVERRTLQQIEDAVAAAEAAEQ